MHDFKWTPSSEAKVFAHGISPAEVEEAFAPVRGRRCRGGTGRT